jgi:UDP-N-acetylmuramyl pentapeptide phosphotransferase/UDP-N-acetylglucosamine-1-phosphate transferase
VVPIAAQTVVSDVGVAAVWAFIAATAIVALVERISRRRNLLDLPVERSSHRLAIPRLGGIGIVAAVWAAALVTASGTDDWLLLVAATAMAGVGLFDDLRPLKPMLRLGLQIAVSALLVATLAPTVSLDLPGIRIVIDDIPAFLAAVIFLVCITNVWNFMDGIDGIAAGTTAIVAVGLLVYGGPTDILVGLLAASLGFLAWNHHPASIFMGDSGSTFMGFLLAGSVLILPIQQPVMPFILIASPFLLDAFVTLAIRLSRGRNILTAHRDHFYQRLVDAGVGQRVVASLYWIGAAACGLVAYAYSEAPDAGRVALVAAVILGFAAYALFVKQYEGRLRRAGAREGSRDR